MLSFRITVSLLAFASMVGCASMEAENELAVARTDLENYIGAVAFHNVDLLEKSGLTDAEIEQRERAAYAQSEKLCFAPYDTGVIDEMNAAMPRISRERVMGLLDLADAIARLDTTLSECLQRFGTTGISGATVQGRDLPMMQYLREGVYAAARYGNALQRQHVEREADKLRWAFALAYGGQSIRQTYPAPGVLYIPPYIKSDGELVRGHLRSLPDAFCFNNLRGCR